MKSKQVKILWISDIHFSSEYKKTLSESSKFAQYFADFVSQVETEIIEDKENSIDYIFLTGDLAQAGIMADYELLLESLLAPLLELFIKMRIQKPKVIAIPGNHDVNWEQSDFLEDYLKIAHELGEKYKKRSEYLEDHLSKFKLLFNDYSKFLLELAIDFKDGRYKDFFDLKNTISLNISPNYQEERLFGYILDHKNHLLINLINTAWFSLGGRFNDILAHNEAKKTGWKVDKIELKSQYDGMTVEDVIRINTETKLKNILKQKEHISEYNNQVTGIHLTEYENFIATQSKYSEYFVLTCMHHPLNWLQWEELYSFDRDSDTQIPDKLNKVLDLSNLVLTGHEHVPKHVVGEPRSDNTVTLKSGCFLFDNQHQNVNLANSWFSILWIDTDRAHVEHKKVYYNIDTKEKRDYWKCDNAARIKKYRLNKVNNGYFLDVARIADIKDMISSTTAEKISSVMQQLDDSECKVISAKELKSTSNFTLFQIDKDGQREICFLAKEHYIYSKFLEDEFYLEISKIIKKLGGDIQVLRFLVLDLFIDNPVLSHLSPKQISDYDSGTRSEQLQRKVNLADDMFDVFRHKFFVRFEEDFGNDKALDPVFNAVRECAFINTILPFWIVENIWRTQ